jgi:hypothetical protein
LEFGVYFRVHIPLVFYRFTIKLLGQFPHTAKLTVILATTVKTKIEGIHIVSKSKGLEVESA